MTETAKRVFGPSRPAFMAVALVVVIFVVTGVNIAYTRYTKGLSS